MTSSDTWSKTWAGKNQQYQALQERLQKALARSSTVVIHGVHQPVQSEWENAYVAQVGQSLPIQPGCRLLWYDVKNGVMELYTTTFDINNNTATSGTVYRALQPHEDREALTTMGNMRQNGYLSNAVIKGRTLHANFMLDRTSFGRQGVSYYRGFFAGRFRQGQADINVSNITIYLNRDTTNPYNEAPIGLNDLYDEGGAWSATLESTGNGIAPVPVVSTQNDLYLWDPAKVMSVMSNTGYGLACMFTMNVAYDERQGAKCMGLYGQLVIRGSGSEYKAISYFGSWRRSGYSFGEMIKLDPQNPEGSLEFYGTGAIITMGQAGGFFGKEHSDG